MNPWRRTPRRVLFVADISGPDLFHAGDEAMLEANLGLFRRLVPRCQAVVSSADPRASAAAYGVPSVPKLRFATGSADRKAEDQAIRTNVAEAMAGSGVAPAFRALLDADALVISGGGNLCSRWPEHILERLALTRLAVAAGKPVFILGQTIGPYLTPPDRALVGEILQSAAWVGVREAPSFALALGLGVPPDRLDLQLDDAFFLKYSDVAPEPRPVIAVTLHAFADPDTGSATFDRLANELQQIAEVSGAELVFVPHARRPAAEGASDLAMAEALNRRLVPRGMMRVAEASSIRDAVAAAHGAALIISSRYHPIVFGLSAGVPCLALPTDEYTRVKLSGALAHAGREMDVLPIGSHCDGLAARALALFFNRERIAAQLQALQPGWRAAATDREQRLAARLAARCRAPRSSSNEVSTRQLARALESAAAEIARLQHGSIDPEAHAILRASQASSTAYAHDLERGLAQSWDETARSMQYAAELSEELHLLHRSAATPAGETAAHQG